MAVKGIIFDMDGVIFDTEKISYQTWHLAEKEFNIKIDYGKLYKLMGTSHDDIISQYSDIMGSIELAKAAYIWRHKKINEIIKADGLIAKPGFIELMEYINSRGLKTALATSTKYNKMLFTFKHSNIENPFTHIITGDMVAASKPNPEIFLKAAEAMKLPIKDCMILEDSYNGITGAIASGAKAVMVVDLMQPTDFIRNNCLAVVNSLSEVINILESLPAD